MTNTPPAHIVFQERWEVVQEEIRRRILVGEFAPGTPLPETELAESMGVSRGPVREALRSLEVAGLVERRPRRPSVVAPLTHADVEELFSVRQAIEVFAIERSMDRRPADLLTALNARLASMRTAGLSNAGHEVFVDEDIAFHSCFYELAENRRSLVIWGTLRDPVRMIMNLSVHGVEPRWDRILQEHEEIVAAVKSSDREAVTAAAVQHLTLARERAEQYLSLTAGAS